MRVEGLEAVQVLRLGADDKADSMPVNAYNIFIDI
jgi:hypothetical protein